MGTLQTELSQLAHQMDEDGLKRHMRAAHYKDAYKQAIEHLCVDNEERAQLILNHTNAFYIRIDDKVVRKGSDKDKPYVVGEVYIDNPVVRSEINMIQELLRLELRYNNIEMEEFRIIASRGNMKNRHPFVKEGESTPEINSERDDRAEKPSTTTSNRVDEKIDDLETVKRAFCLVFGVDAEQMLATIAAADIEYVRDETQAENNEFAYQKILHIYINGETARTLIDDKREAIISRARDLELNLSDIVIHSDNTESIRPVAFPPCAQPIPLTKGDSLFREI